jgi:predicted phage-related endonuclease
MIYEQSEIKQYKGFDYIERHGMKFFPLVDLDGVVMPRADWLRLRALDGCIGGSDIGTIFDLNKYMSSLELFYQKIGLNFSAGETHTPATFWGTYIEDDIRYAAQFWDKNDEQAYLYNATIGYKLREITELKFSVRNPELPFLNINIDGAIGFIPETWMMRRIFESKTISRQSAEMWESRVPPYQLLQVQGYLRGLKPMLLEDVGEIYYLKDGREFYGAEIPLMPDLADSIIEKSKDFYERVQKGLEIVANIKDLNERERALHEVEPDVTGNPAYEKYLSEEFKKKLKFVKIKGSSSDQEAAVNYKRTDEKIKKLEKELQLYKNQIWQTLSQNTANIVELPDGGKISFNRRLYVNPSTK